MNKKLPELNQNQFFLYEGSVLKKTISISQFRNSDLIAPQPPNQSDSLSDHQLKSDGQKTKLEFVAIVSHIGEQGNQKKNPYIRKPFMLYKFDNKIKLYKNQVKSVETT